MATEMVQRVREQRGREGVEKVERERWERERMGRLGGMVGGGVVSGVVAGSESGWGGMARGGGGGGDGDWGGRAGGGSMTEMKGTGKQKEEVTGREDGMGAGAGARGFHCGNVHAGVIREKGEPKRKRIKTAGAGGDMELAEKEDSDRFKVTGDMTAWMNGSK